MQRLDLLVTRHFPRQAGKMRFAFGEQPWPTTGSKRDACCPRLSAKIDNMLVSLMRIAPKDVVRNNFPYLHRRIWAHSVVARRLFSQLHGASCA